MNIGQAAKASGISAKMIRHYETIGLIEAADRTSSGYRVYTQNDVETLRFIRSSRDLGFQVEQIKELLALWRDRNRASADVKKVALQHVEDLEAKMKQLQNMAETLRHLAHNCQGNNRPDCPIIQELATHSVQKPVRPAPRKGELLHGKV
ncbi:MULTISPECIES: Cu(I)-responsive transcriptional regulator [Brucella]|uniref:Cu(I)-responsive transcriptional regulator n=1 Tax=Brucella pituitosa TaxID=571256 RepID=A0A643F420_9HYPH|nr:MULTISPECIES: Cu(I)-responsive transcriptional regulator [Brucella]PQZ49242.1 Cu(I)-responsive transcriptional regulator [Ochrobactrum sp. MYb19]PRA57551.1 Cu(I)-responsive transcriptional regulator [Ochrobactrum sp. MYb68]PRA66940.1 Cu(I)-responsive transcriptional regulator [Ochrobactrum sp. MYb18]PRA76030.1 Cu(I)-responsive transcriptional regulator [Brucella thiophenivorans]PRA91950.1 Cu(I)-responsive transcriptional regulator [Ochrobactrum sp. MYb14]PRA98038.1 Cu(I)-responsive transcr